MFRARVVTALLLCAGFLAVVFLLPPQAAAIVFALAAALAGWEWAGLMQAGPRGRVLYGLLVFVLCLLFGTRPEDGFPLLWGIAVLFWLTVAPLCLRCKWSCAGSVTGLIVLVPTWAALTALHQRSALLLLAVMALVWVADIAAFSAGRTFGRRQLAPQVSPGKTWEGVAGAMVGVLAYGLAVAPFLPVVHCVRPALLAGLLLLLAALSIVGDLFESLAKRQAGVKDSSALLPGHGGILDRIDSLTSTLPAVALALYWIA